MTNPAAHHLLSVYRAACGRSEVPDAYHLWSGLALLSATLADRVWVRKFSHTKLVPNLYIMLVGPSGGGKGVAIGMAQRIAEEVPRVYTHGGPITAQGLFTALARRITDPSRPPGGKIFLVQEELGMSVGEGQMARDFVKHLTGLYEAGRPYPLTKRTATDGDTKLTSHCITFLGGTDKPWLIESVPRNAIEGGFFGRTACIIEKYNFALRITEPERPANYDELCAHLVDRLRLLSYLEGEIEKSDEFKEAEDSWYQTRPAPEDEAMLPTWRREHDFCLKIVTLLVAGDAVGESGTPRLRAELRHWKTALPLVRAALAGIPELVAFAGQTPDAAKLDITRRQVRKAGRLHHSVLLRRVSTRGIDAKLLAQHIETLRQEGRVQVLWGPPREYTWRERGKMPKPQDIPATEWEEGEEDAEGS